MSKTLRVLFVEDMEDDALLLIRELTRAGYDLVQERVEDIAGMKAALENRDWDLIIADYNLPRFSGLAAIEFLRETGRDIPLIIISGTVGEDVAVEALKIGAHDYIMKNNLIRLVPAVEREMREAATRREHQQAEEALKESEERYRELAESIRDIFFAMDGDMRYTYWNRASEDFTGITADEALGRSIYDLFPDVRGTLMEDVYKKVLATGRAQTVIDEYSMDGKEYWLEITAYPTTSGLSVFIRDISDRRRSAERLTNLSQSLLNLGAEPEENMDKIITASLKILDADLVKYWRVRGDRYFLHLGRSRLPGYKEAGDSIDRASFESMFMWQRGPFDAEEMGEARLLEADPDISEFGLKAMIGHPVMVKDEIIIGCLCLYSQREREFDREEMELASMISRAISIEEERWADETRLRSFIDIASHELRHPITIMKGYAITLRDMGDELDEVKRREALGAIDRGADRLGALLTELLDTSRIVKGELVIEKREAAFQGIVDSAMLAVKEKHEDRRFVVDIDEGVGDLYVDPRKISTVIEALLDNAAKFSPPDSEVGLSVEKVGGEFIISVLDRGDGVPVDQRDMIFWRFYQVGEVIFHSVPGLGLGLYIAKQIIESHDGRIWYRPNEGGGSVFSFTLPVQ